MGKFTQQQLEEAWQQMQAERHAEAQQAGMAAAWVQKEIGFGNCRASRPEHFRFGSAYGPFPIGIVMTLIHETYGPYVPDYLKVLDVATWATNTGRVKGLEKTPIYEVQTPYGNYNLEFEYFDNHFSGY